jgi:hypothetical protein
VILKRAPQPEPLLEVARTPSFARRMLLGIALAGALCAAFLGAIGYGMYLHEVKVADSLATLVENAGWEPTGAVTFYESPVRISHAEFAFNRSEDGLNVVRSDFSIETTLFRDTRSDAFDADFANGSITRSSFVRAGNDAIDVSGSSVILSQVRVNGAGDKGVSGGVDVRDAVIGVASKDLSRIEVRSLRVRGADVGLAVFQKKSEFGPASIEARKLSLEGVRTPYLVETGSSVVVAGKSIASNGERLREALYSAKGVVDVEQGG